MRFLNLWRRGCCHLLLWKITARVQEFLWVLRDTLHQHFKMQMRTCRASGSSNFSDFLPALDQVTFFDKQLGGMGITGDEIIAMINLHHIAVIGIGPRRDHYATRGSKNTRPGLCLEIQAGM